MLQEEMKLAVHKDSRGIIIKKETRNAKSNLRKDSSQIVDAPLLRHMRDMNILMFINARQATQQKASLAPGKFKPLH